MVCQNPVNVRVGGGPTRKKSFAQRHHVQEGEKKTHQPLGGGFQHEPIKKKRKEKKSQETGGGGG